MVSNSRYRSGITRFDRFGLGPVFSGPFSVSVKTGRQYRKGLAVMADKEYAGIPFTREHDFTMNTALGEFGLNQSTSVEDYNNKTNRYEYLPVKIRHMGSITIEEANDIVDSMIHFLASHGWRRVNGVMPEGIVPTNRT